ncbi:efflux RND transporter periplasmic adaptor subunit [Phyllobacterium zundukense]|uniref:Uncharacterized protein n=1 Tax=Phyllobacterium zundukense TaxID=1867719 RepID=A0ACD4CYE5_9HYPH|nr:hypothetical protein [Phyllobacterium zundukense]UXN58625.1 hypothetical protein N8E88_11565 [Phyllobacterium zundukense]
MLTEIDVTNTDRLLEPGIYCTVELQIPSKVASFSVPSDALIFNSDGLQVAVVDNGIVHLRKISVARDLGTTIEVNSGLKSGDKVVRNPPVQLVEGTEVSGAAAPVTPAR